MSDLYALNWDAYELIDSGLGDKLERIGNYYVQRPCPQAIWARQRPQKDWQQAQSVCHRNADGGGYWEHPPVKGKNKEPRFDIAWPVAGEALRFQVRFTSFGHCGIFFEQSSIWQLLFERTKALAERLGRAPKMANLFGYTGCASLVMAAAGAEVFHVDSAKGVLNWGKENQQLNPWLSGSVRWIHDDVRSFLQFSEKRGFAYDGILVDPPSWGHGTKKQKWNFDEDIAELVSLLLACTNKEQGFCLLSSHTHGVQHQALKNVFFNNGANSVDCGELGVKHAHDERILPAGIYALANFS